MVPSVVSSLLLFATALSSQVAAHPHPHAHDDHEHTHAMRSALPETWFHRADHPVQSLFKRGGDGVTYAEVGSPEWAAGFPDTEDMDPNGAGLPQAWIDALDAAIKAGKIPDVPVSQDTGGNPIYPNNLDPLSPEICSSTYKCRNDDDLWDAPDGVFSSGFDDGPVPAGIPLYNFLKENNVVTTHFMIGSNIKYNAEVFKMAFNDLQSDLAVHTWTHPYMTTLTNYQVLGELGWTMEIIHNSTGGRIPKYWRPPFGDSDERVRAIAKEVFGLTTVIWNQDTEDWSVGQPGGYTIEQVDADLQKWITGPKSPGLMILEHELNENTIGAFMRAYPLIAENGWKFESTARHGGDVYQNAADNTGDVTPATVGVIGAAIPDPETTTTTTSGGTTKPPGTTGAPTAPTAPGNSQSGNSTTTPTTTPAGGEDQNSGVVSRPMTLVASLVVAAAAFALS